jgi:hypothetical protein
MLIKLGDFVQDDVGTQWHAVIEQRHFSEVDVVRFVLKEKCLKDHRFGICKDDGSEFACKASTAKSIVNVVVL